MKSHKTILNIDDVYHVSRREGIPYTTLHNLKVQNGNLLVPTSKQKLTMSGDTYMLPMTWISEQVALGLTVALKLDPFSLVGGIYLVAYKEMSLDKLKKVITKEVKKVYKQPPVFTGDI